jgi:NTP pyrophosphatase (non-canonical NTP hydrolase)
VHRCSDEQRNRILDERFLEAQFENVSHCTFIERLVYPTGRASAPNYGTTEIGCDAIVTTPHLKQGTERIQKQLKLSAYVSDGLKSKYRAIEGLFLQAHKLRVKNTQLDNLICNLRGEVGEVITSWVLLRHMIARERELTSDDVARRSARKTIRMHPKFSAQFSF